METEPATDMEREHSTIILVRHAHAAWPEPGENDLDRKLDARGQAEAVEMAERITELGIMPERVLCSPAARCRDTLVELEKRWTGKPDVIFDGDLYDGGLPIYADIVTSHEQGGPLMIIGHNPMIEDIFAFMVHGQEQDFLGYTTGAIAILHREAGSGRDSKWHLDHFYQPTSAL
ncbi:histidine phosphatase family protein [Rhizobium sp. L1K21]|uniref:SixA phosphatase family protein n=1 Tax=Rhizobium sp. L1K21 TaxID=2954933 RepID=UPI002092D8DC|nr:histidine phosphatase family protein [Rhizobium sp. L1K21]MCO6186203.1 histidine phosphatase family protein [Rhizobium sp. L1K21]